jgi:hypothetical protein
MNKLDILKIAKVRQKLVKVSVLRKLDKVSTSEFTDVGLSFQVVRIPGAFIKY